MQRKCGFSVVSSLDLYICARNAKSCRFFLEFLAKDFGLLICLSCYNPTQYFPGIAMHVTSCKILSNDPWVVARCFVWWNAQNRAKQYQSTVTIVSSFKPLQAAGVLAQIEKNNKKRQGVEVYCIHSFVLENIKQPNSLNFKMTFLHDRFLFVHAYSGPRTRKKPSKQRSRRLTTKKEARTMLLLGYGTMVSSTLLIPGGFWASASLLRPSRFLKTRNMVYSGCKYCMWICIHV